MKIILVLFTTLFLLAAPSFAGSFDTEPLSENVIDARTKCEQGSATDAILSAKAKELRVITLKPEAVERTAAKINENLKASGKPERAIDGFAMVDLTGDASMVMLYQFYEGCVVSAVMAPSSLMFPALVKLGVAQDDWE